MKRIEWKGVAAVQSDPDSMVWLQDASDGYTPAGFSDWAQLREFCAFVLSLPPDDADPLEVDASTVAASRSDDDPVDGEGQPRLEPLTVHVDPQCRPGYIYAINPSMTYPPFDTTATAKPLSYDEIIAAMEKVRQRGGEPSTWDRMYESYARSLPLPPRDTTRRVLDS